MPDRGGRPPEDDWPRLHEMALLLVQGLASSIRSAAERASEDVSEGYRPAVIDRIRRKYSRDRTGLERRARELLATADAPARRPRPPAEPRSVAAPSPRDSIAKSDRESVAKPGPSILKKTTD